MSSFAGALVAALRTALKADPGIAALVGSKVYDQVPGDARGQSDDAHPPWVAIGPIVSRRHEDNCFMAWSPRVRIYCASTAFGRGEAWDIADAVNAALDQKDLALVGPFAMASALRALESGDVLDPLAARQVYADFTCVIYRTAPFVA